MNPLFPIIELIDRSAITKVRFQRIVREIKKEHL
jgi:hypothetical protein